MKKYKYKISVVVPVYNNEEYIDKCLNSLVNQSIGFKNIQVILINDGSSDNSISVLNKYSSNDNILIIDKENTGVSDTRNIGMSKSVGKYIMFLDSDDYLSLDACLNLYSFFEDNYDNVDLVTYPIIYDKNGKLNAHKRYINQYYLGSGVYDLDSEDDIIQTTINIMIKNEFDNNIKFNVEQRFSEDERFSVEILMKKKKIGFCKEAKYFYRRHPGTATNTIINPLYSFEMTIAYYEELFEKYKDNNGVYKYIQRLYLNNIGWRIKQNVFLPVHLDGKNYDNAINRIRNLVSMIDTNVLEKSLNVDTYHKFFLLKLINRKINIKKSDNEYVIDCDDTELYRFKYIDGIISRFKLVGNKIELMASLMNPMFDYIKPKLYIKKYCNGQVVEDLVDINFSNESYYKSSFETTKSYGFDIFVDADVVNHFKFFIDIDGSRIPIQFKVKKFVSDNCIYKYKYLLYSGSNMTFYVKKNNFINKLKSRFSNFRKVLLKKPKICLYRILYYLYPVKKNLCLYVDGLDNFDNSYVQFIHDFDKKDEVNRFYITKLKEKDINANFLERHKSNIIRYGSLKHKIYYLKATNIVTSYIDLRIYCPFGNSIAYYKDLARYRLIYLQHGLLHADLVKSYAKEFTEIDKFVVSSKFEKNNLIDKYHYKEEDICEAGMPRFGKKKKISTVNKILFAPSWRKYLVGNLINNNRKLMKNEFVESTFYKEIYSFLHSNELSKLLEENSYTMDFKLHPIFKNYAYLFDLDKVNNINIDFTDTSDYKIFITDFSSFQFDFAYLKRPIIYYVPDMKEFKAGLHTYRKLDLDYKDAFGKLCLSKSELLKELKRIIVNNGMLSSNYEKRVEKFFLDINNPCEDIYKLIRGDMNEDDIEKDFTKS